MRLGIMGLPLAGKTTLFNALTGAHGARGGYSGHANTAVVALPDERMDRLAQMFPPQKMTRAQIEYVDIPGVSASDRRDHIVSVLTALREVDALMQVVRAFESEAAPHPRGSVDPARDAREIWQELVIADLDVAERRVEKLRKQITKPTPQAEEDKRQLAALERCIPALEQERGVRDAALSDEDRHSLRAFQFFTEKPMLTVLNVHEDMLGGEEAQRAAAVLGPDMVVVSAQIEMEIAQLAPDERQEFMQQLGLKDSALARLVKACYRLLRLRSFFTGVGVDFRAWTIREGETAWAAAGKVHNDMQRGFIRAEVMHYDDLVQFGSEKALRAAGRMRSEGRDYVVRDGDIILFRFKV
jgi:GTP-binding protein YchF